MRGIFQILKELVVGFWAKIQRNIRLALCMYIPKELLGGIPQILKESMVSGLRLGGISGQALYISVHKELVRGIAKILQEFLVSGPRLERISGWALCM